MPCSMPGRPFASISRAGSEGAEQGASQRFPNALFNVRAAIRQYQQSREGAEQGASQRPPLDGDQKSSGITLNGCSEALTLPILRLGSLTGSAGSSS